MKKLASLILALSLCASVLTAAVLADDCAAQQDPPPAPTVTVEPQDPKDPVEPEEPGDGVNGVPEKEDEDVKE